MSRLQYLGRGTPLDDGITDPGDGGGEWVPPPYYAGEVPAVPTSAPWHRDVPCDIPTYDGFDQTLHPTVVDFGGLWNGYRWWMSHTPYPIGVGIPVPDDHENPSIAASNDCVTWTPIGDILATAPPGYNSDNEMVWNPTAQRLELWWRYVAFPVEHLYHRHSADGSTWATRTEQGLTEIAPCIIRYSDTDWRMWERASFGTVALQRRLASSPEGPWSDAVTCTVAGGPDPSLRNLWHQGIARDPETDTLYLLGHMETPGPGNIEAAISVDGGQSWTWGGTGVLTKQSGTWTELSLYRPYPVLHENGTHMRVWYSGKSAALGWKTGYAELPLTLWPSP